MLVKFSHRTKLFQFLELEKIATSTETWKIKVSFIASAFCAFDFFLTLVTQVHVPLHAAQKIFRDTRTEHKIKV